MYNPDKHPEVNRKGNTDKQIEATFMQALQECMDGTDPIKAYTNHSYDWWLTPFYLKVDSMSVGKFEVYVSFKPSGLTEGKIYCDLTFQKFLAEPVSVSTDNEENPLLVAWLRELVKDLPTRADVLKRLELAVVREPDLFKRFLKFMHLTLKEISLI